MPRLYSVRKRDLLFLVLTTVMTGVYYFAGQRVANHINTMNSARVVGALMTARVEQSPRPGTSAIGQIFGGMGVRNTPTAEEKAATARLQRQVATVEVVVYAWRWMIRVVAGWLAWMVILSLATARFRLWQMMAGNALLLSTMGTVIGLWLLVSPGWGGMPPLRWMATLGGYVVLWPALWSFLVVHWPALLSLLDRVPFPGMYITVPGAQAIYGLILIAVYRHRPANSASEPSQGDKGRGTSLDCAL